jgi:uncharacterized protein
MGRLDAQPLPAHYGTMTWLRADPNGVVLSVRIVPRAGKNEVSGLLGDALKIRLQAPPIEGKANEALIRFLADVLDVSPRQVRLLSGQTSRNKTVLVEGLSEADTRGRLGQPT